MPNPNRRLCYPIEPARRDNSCFRSAVTPRPYTPLRACRGSRIALTLASFAVLRPSPTPVEIRMAKGLLLPFIPGLLVSTAFGMAKSALSHGT